MLNKRAGREKKEGRKSKDFFVRVFGEVWGKGEKSGGKDGKDRGWG